MINKRNISSLIILISIIFLPYWIYITFLVAAIIYFQFYWEGILLGLLIDALYGKIGLDLMLRSIGFWSLVLLVALLPLRKLLRTYA